MIPRWKGSIAGISWRPTSDSEMQNADRQAALADLVDRGLVRKERGRCLSITLRRSVPATFGAGCDGGRQGTGAEVELCALELCSQVGALFGREHDVTEPDDLEADRSGDAGPHRQAQGGVLGSR